MLHDNDSNNMGETRNIPHKQSRFHLEDSSRFHLHSLANRLPCSRTDEKLRSFCLYLLLYMRQLVHNCAVEQNNPTFEYCGYAAVGQIGLVFFFLYAHLVICDTGRRF